MASIQNLILAAALVSTASAQYRTTMSSESFNHWPAASAYTGEMIKFDYFTSPSTDEDLQFLHNIKPVVLRMHESALLFHPHQVIISGGDARCVDGMENYRDKHGCDNHCENHYRYCDLAAMDPSRVHRRHQNGPEGHFMVEESARRQCIWDKYGSNSGHNEMFRYFQYTDAMHATGCHQEMTDTCVEEAMNSVGFNFNDIEQCAGLQGDHNEDVVNPVLEELVKGGHTGKVPALKVNKKEQLDFENMNAAGVLPKGDSVLKMVCNAMPNNDKIPKPHVCEFCLNYCPNKAGDEFDMATCLWELKCGDRNGTQFTDYLGDYREEHPDKEHAVASVMADAGKGAPKDNGSSTKSTVEGMGVIATFMAVIFAAGFCALAVMAIRVWRTKMIIDRYVKEQQAMNGGLGGGFDGIDGHRDPTYFPEEGELDLDLEPALQYSDHIATNGRSSPPTQANFLPQLT